MDRRVLFISAVFLLALAGVVIARNDLVIGSIGANSVLMYSQTYNRTGLPGQLISEDIVFTNQIRNVTRVRALDLNYNGTGGYASIVYGGVGLRNVTVRLQSSAVGRGYEFFVDIYGN